MTDDKIEDNQGNPQSCTECQGVNTSTVSTRLNLNMFVLLSFLLADQVYNWWYNFMFFPLWTLLSTTRSLSEYYNCKKLPEVKYHIKINKRIIKEFEKIE